MVELQSATGYVAQINPTGAFVEFWTKADGTELLYARRDMSNGKNRGGIPICAPIFGPGDVVGLNQHGFARNCTWVVDEQTQSQVKLSLDNPASHVEDLPPVYAGCGLELVVALSENSLLETLIVRNIGIEPFTLNPAFHPYFPIGSDSSAVQAEISVDDQTYKLTEDELLATRKIDSTNSVARLQTTQGIWTITGEGLPLFAVWSESPRNFICVEPTESGYLGDTPPGELAPNESKIVSMVLTYAARPLDS